MGAEWVLYLLLLVSVLSIALIFERFHFYYQASKGLTEFRKNIRDSIAQGKTNDAMQTAKTRFKDQTLPDMETEMTLNLLSHPETSAENSYAALGEVAQDAVVRARLAWDKNLAILATIGSNAPFVGLFGTVLGIIKAFHDLSQQSNTGAQTVTSGISEALVATAIGLLVAIPAVVAYNLFQRRVKSALAEAEALKCYLIGKKSENRGQAHGR